ncbi:hypothetical protein [Roseivirga echinicomitans]|uniref:SH3b domain-containing protein n=1 Tax=Roseivirga echinicomitans TaxID=296218 RepID=A0A150XY22_9BACT|nr:hypothetical protein [Roseivirga echinicomitans]KYG83554.1 hypothetical protein AWN68_01760 [Roseivirga echinicomitans]
MNRITLSRYVFFILGLIFSQELSAQALSNAEQYYAWNVKSTVVYAETNTESEVLDSLAFGTEVFIKDTSYPKIIRDFQVESDQNQIDYSLKGHWVKIVAGDVEGYVFDGELSKRLPLKLTENKRPEREDDYLERTLGEGVVTEENEPLGTEPNIYYRWIKDIKFADGSYIHWINQEGCDIGEFFISGASINQVYFMFTAFLYDNRSRIYFPNADIVKLTKVKGTRLEFTDSEESYSNHITIKEDGKVVFGGGLCG